ncbi:MAG TPA: sigma-70 family RNA polymerase sigma factor [Nocardioidaceae bacterium]|nr:sigma-70 family RNA polymerase sigma factor [Nocardioidaceae bacterium]
MKGVSDAVVTAAQAGDGDALATIYEALAPRVMGYLRARGAEDPESLTNEVFLHVLVKLDRLEGGAGGLRTFVFSVAHARVVDETRQWARRPAQSSYEIEYDDRREPSAEAEALELVATRDTLELLEELNQEQRAVITLRVLGDLSIEETAHVVGKSTGAVKQLQRRGLATLRALLERGEQAR